MGYNNWCQAGNPNAFWESLNQWLAFSAKTNGPKIFIGVPAERRGANIGYITPDKLKEIYMKAKSEPRLGGIMMWDSSFDQNNIINGKHSVSTWVTSSTATPHPHTHPSHSHPNPHTRNPHTNLDQPHLGQPNPITRTVKVFQTVFTLNVTAGSTSNALVANSSPSNVPMVSGSIPRSMPAIGQLMWIASCPHDSESDEDVQPLSIVEYLSNIS